eukprot:CAMPEP_0119290162 /NCGR_PEP_ID=MMETSP1329-20130426/40279_1 /TAXON_ID=114041 /ORGANISM="Genus nov. species nov., Strain RCC1024" /LENGTH=132 /DNA_ID=CAMNT_0007290977 /DNA_START=169 /DNA_END=563 /DNA_ORIENTATION=-
MSSARTASACLILGASLAAAAALLVRARRRRRARRRAIAAMPKVEFHAHLHGSIRRATLEELATQKGLEAKALLDGPRDLEACFAIFRLIHACVDSLAVVERVCRETLEDLEAENVAYVELRSTPRALGDAS